MNRAEKWRLKHVSLEVRRLRTELHQLRHGRDLLRWPTLVRNIQALERDLKAALEAMEKLRLERDALRARLGEAVPS